MAAGILAKRSRKTVAYYTGMQIHYQGFCTKRGKPDVCVLKSFFFPSIWHVRLSEHSRKQTQTYSYELVFAAWVLSDIVLFFQSDWFKWKDLPHLEVEKHKQDNQLQVSLEATLWTQCQVKGTCQSMLSIRKSWVPVYMAGQTGAWKGIIIKGCSKPLLSESRRMYWRQRERMVKPSSHGDSHPSCPRTWSLGSLLAS